MYIVQVCVDETLAFTDVVIWYSDMNASYRWFLRCIDQWSVWMYMYYLLQFKFTYAFYLKISIQYSVLIALLLPLAIWKYLLFEVGIRISGFQSDPPSRIGNCSFLIRNFILTSGSEFASQPQKFNPEVRIKKGVCITGPQDQSADPEVRIRNGELGIKIWSAGGDPSLHHSDYYV